MRRLRRHSSHDVDPLTVSLAVRLREQPYAPVIGVVGDVREGSIRESAQPTVFYANRQVPQDMMTLLLRAPHAEALARPAIAALHALDPNLPVTNVRTVDSAFAESVARERLSAMVSGAFALSGLLVASLGLYALLAFLVTERTKEIGLRIALGAQVSFVTRSVVGGGLRLVGIGAAVGVGLSMLLLRSLGALLYGVTPYDPSTYVSVVALLCACRRPGVVCARPEGCARRSPSRFARTEAAVMAHGMVTSRSEVHLEVDVEHRAPGADGVGIGRVSHGRSVHVHPLAVEANPALLHHVPVLAASHFPLVAVFGRRSARR